MSCFFIILSSFLKEIIFNIIVYRIIYQRPKGKKIITFQLKGKVSAQNDLCMEMYKKIGF